MGTAICDTPKDKISFDGIELILRRTINNKELDDSRKNNSIVYNLHREYYKLKSQSIQQIYQSSKLTKNINNFTPLKKLKKIFLQWFHILYDTENNEFTANDLYRLKSENFSIEKYFKTNLKKFYKNREEYFLKLISKGIPSYLRVEIWIIVLDNEGKKKDYNSKTLSIKEEEREFLNLLSQEKTNEQKQIFKDISRTFTNENQQTDFNMNLLKDLLIAMTNLDKNLGYCQGINFIVGFILQLTNFSKIKAYHLSKLIIPKIKNYYTENFPKLQEDLKLFDANFKYFYPKLYEHFTKNDLDNKLFAGKWIQTLFTICIPFNELCMIWDTFFENGFDFIVFISLAILDHTEKELLKLNDSSDIIEFLQNTLNPDKKDLKQNIYIEYVDDIRKFIIPLRDIISTAKRIKTEYESNIKNLDNLSYNIKFKTIFEFLINDKNNKSPSSSLSTTDEINSNKINCCNKNNDINNSVNERSRIKKRTIINRHKDNYNREKIGSNETKRNYSCNCKPFKDFFSDKKSNLSELNIIDNNSNYSYNYNKSSIIHNPIYYTKPNNFHTSKNINSYYNTYNTISNIYDFDNKYNNQYYRNRDPSPSSSYISSVNSNYRSVNRSSSTSLKFYRPYDHNYRRLSGISDGIESYGREIPLLNFGLFRK